MRDGSMRRVGRAQANVATASAATISAPLNAGSTSSAGSASERNPLAVAMNAAAATTAGGGSGWRVLARYRAPKSSRVLFIWTLFRPQFALPQRLLAERDANVR